jgi:beta-glucosidase
MSGELGAYDIVVGNIGDRNDLKLWWNGDSLIERVAAVCNNTIVVVHSVGPVLMSWSNHPNISSIIYAGAPGEQTGPALVDVIYGAYNPSGRLPFTIGDVSLIMPFSPTVDIRNYLQNEDDYGTSIIYDSLGFPDVFPFLLKRDLSFY